MLITYACHLLHLLRLFYLLLYLLYLWIDPESLRYAPSTIAIAALLLTFSQLRVSCTDWLNRLPDACLMPQDNTPRGDRTKMPGHLMGLSSSSSLGGDVVARPFDHTSNQPPQIGGLRPLCSFYSIEDFPYLDVDSCLHSFQRMQQRKFALQAAPAAPPAALPAKPLAPIALSKIASCSETVASPMGSPAAENLITKKPLKPFKSPTSTAAADIGSSDASCASV
jgi:hypothetical protein